MHRDHSGLRRLGAGHLEATAETLVPRSFVGRAFYNLKGFVVGTPLAEAAGPRALEQGQSPCSLSSDALSSSAYATEESSASWSWRARRR